MSEALYDERVAPLLAEAAKICMELDMPFLALVEYAKDERGETRVILPDEGLAMTMARGVAKFGVHIDGYLIGLIRHCNKNKIDISQSMFIGKYAESGQSKEGPI